MGNLACSPHGSGFEAHMLSSTAECLLRFSACRLSCDGVSEKKSVHAQHHFPSSRLIFLLPSLLRPSPHTNHAITRVSFASPGSSTSGADNDGTQHSKSYCGVIKVSPILNQLCFKICWSICFVISLTAPVWKRGPGTKLKTRGREGEKYRKGDFGSELIAFNIIRA